MALIVPKKIPLSFVKNTKNLRFKKNQNSIKKIIIRVIKVINGIKRARNMIDGANITLKSCSFGECA